VSLEEGRRALGAETLVNSLIFLELRTVQLLNSNYVNSNPL
jgi:hypothetical protein